MVSRDTKTTAAFVVLAVLLWIGASAVTDNELVQWGVLIGVGLILPMAITQRRASE
jgi:low temperature requirement protein LtrA